MGEEVLGSLSASGTLGVEAGNSSARPGTLSKDIKGTTGLKHRTSGP